MTWTRLSDDFADKPGIVELSDAAFRTLVEGLVYGNKHLTDGWMPKAVAQRALTHHDAQTLAELLAGGHVADEGESWRFDWSDQETAQTVTDRAKRNAQFQAEWRERKALCRDGDHSKCKNCAYVREHGTPHVKPNVSPDVSTDVRPYVTEPLPDPSPTIAKRGRGGPAPAGAERTGACTECSLPHAGRRHADGHEYQAAKP